MAGTLIPLGGRLVSKLTGIPEKALLMGTGNAAKLAEERLAATLAKGTAIGAVAEIPTEVAQQMLERAQAGLSLTSPDALEEYGQTAYQVGLLAPIGAAGRVSERAGARQEVQRKKEEEAAQAAAQAEAAKNQPDALRQLDDQYRAAVQQRDALNAQVEAAKPGKGAAEEAKAAYEKLKADRAEFINTQFKPLKQEFEKRKGAIEQMYAGQQAAMEAEAAPGQAAAKLPAPSDIPGAQPFQLSSTAQMMNEYDNLRTQVGQLEDRLAAGPDVDTQAQLTQQRSQLMARMQEMAPIIEERGGVTESEAEFTKKLAAADKERLKLLEQGDFDNAAKQAEKIKALQARMPLLQELKDFREKKGQTKDMFVEMPAAPTTPVDEQLRQQTLEEEKQRALYGPESKRASAEQAFGEAEIGPRGRLEPREVISEQVAKTGIKPKQLENVQAAQDALATAQDELTQAAGTKDTAAIYAAADKVNQAKAAEQRVQEEVGRTTFKPSVLDIFSPANVMDTAIQNGDTKLINDLAAHADRTALREALDQTTSERDKLVKVLESRLDLGGSERATTKAGPKTGEPLRSVKRERVDLFSQLYGPEERAKFTNGTNLEVIKRPRTELVQEFQLDKKGKPVIGKDGKPVVVKQYEKKVLDKDGRPIVDTVRLQDVYDKGGPAAVEYERVMQDIEELSRKVTTKQGNAKESLYEQLLRTYADIEAMTAQLESGVATPNMREKAAGLQAKLGKGEAPAERQMDAAEKHNLRRRIKAATEKYDRLVGKITPVRDKILELYNSLYQTTALEKPSVVAKKKAEAATEAAKGPKAKSRMAATAARLARGDVRREAETSQKMRDLARELGEREPEYKKFNNALTKRLEALKAKYNPNDSAVNAFRITMGQERINKAEELGRKTPEYKATLKEQIAYFKEVLPTAGKQEVPTKRTGPVTRKQSGAPKTLRVAGSAMTEREIEREIAEGTEAEKKRMLRGVETESLPLDQTAVSYLEKNDIRGALMAVSNNKQVDEFSRAVAENLAQMLDVTRVKLVKDLRDADGKEVLGAATSKLIEINTNGGLSVETLLHEATHAAAERVVQLSEQSPTSLSKEQKVAIQELRAIHARVKADTGITSQNAKGSLSEFVAEVMSNRNLQKQLAQRKWRLSDMWKGIQSVIMRMLGLQKVETMFGASVVSVEQLFIPASAKVGAGQKETRVTRKLSAKDIAALHDGSNSMKQFADQFGPLIKQKDRTPEDVERIGQQAIDDMIASVIPWRNRGTVVPKGDAAKLRAEHDAKSVVAIPSADTLDYKSMATMPDGTLFDENNPLHFVEAEPTTFAALKAMKDAGLREREAEGIASQRRQDFLSLAEYLTDNYQNYTTAEIALVLKAAAKWAVLSDADGKLKLAEMRRDNRHNVAVVGKEGADAVIEQLRAGKSLKQAFLDGLQKNADENAKKNERKSGWKKFDQNTDPNTLEEAATELNAACAGTSWCTGSSSKDYARNQIKGGDFYVYYKDGRPEVAVRMNGQSEVGEVRGNTPGQALTREQRSIAESFLAQQKFNGAETYLEESRRRAVLRKMLSDPDYSDYKALLSLGELVSAHTGQLRGYKIKNLLDFHGYGGYSRPEASEKAVEKLTDKVTAVLKKAYEANNFIGSEVKFSAKQPQVEVEFAGTKYTADINTIESALKLDLDVSTYREKEQLTVPKLREVGRMFVSVDVVAPNLKQVGDLQFFGTRGEELTVTVNPDAVVSKLQLYSKYGTAILKGAKTVEYVQEPIDDAVVILPDAKYANIEVLQGNDLYAMAEGDLRSYVRDAINEADKDTLWGVMRSFPTGLSVEGKRAFKTAMRNVAETFGIKNFNIESQEYYDEEAALTTIFNAFFNEQAGDYTRNEMLAYGKRANDTLGLKRSERLIERMGMVDAPSRVANSEFGQEYEEAPEERRFAPKNVGVEGDEKKGFTFLRKKPETDSVVGRELSLGDKLLTNIMGLAGRVQFIDQYAALEAATKKGLEAGVISSLEATNANYLLRFGQQRSQFAGQFLTNGPVRAEHTKKAGGVETVYRSTKGTSMMDVANALNKAKLGSDVEQENMFTVYLAGKRANQVGWEKLNFKDPGKAKAEYQNVLDRLDADKNAKAAFEDAAKLYQEYNAGLLDFLVDTGAMTAKKAAELKAISYVPFYRINDNGEVQLMIDKETPVRISNIKDQPQLKELVGGNTAILPVFTSAAQNTFMLTGMGLRNQAVKETAFMLQKLGIASAVRPGKGPAGDSVVRFFKNGDQYYALIDKEQYGIPAELIVRGMEGIKTTLPAVIKAMGVPANLLRSFVVRNPAYAVRQVIRDPLNAWLTTGTDATPVLSSMKELASMVAGRSEAERKLMQTGAISSNVFSGDEQDMAKFLKDLSAGKSMWDKALGRLDAFALQGDAATRAVIYKDSLAKGMTEQEALLRTLESMNFSRRGVSPSMQALSVMIPFFNAQIQGLDVIYRAFKGDMPYSEQLKIKEKLIQRGLMLAAGTLAYAAFMDDDEAYKRARPEERYANWFVRVPGIDEPVRVPIPFEMGFLFKALPEAVYNMAVNDEKAGKAMGGLFKLAQQTNPFSLPQAVKPLTEAVLGKSFYGGDIESAREKSELATDRYRESTTELAKVIGAVTGQVGVSPITIDYLIRGYTGGLGIALIQLANPLLASDTKAEVAQPTTKVSKMPFIGGLFQPTEGRGTLDEAYDRMQEIQQTKGTFNKLIEEGKRAEAKEFAQEYANTLASMSISGAVQKRLGDLAKVERQIRANPKLTTEEKDARLEQLDKAKMAIARQFLAVSR